MQRKGALTGEVAAAIKSRAAHLGRAFIASWTGLDLSNLTPAEERIVEAVSEYVSVMKRRGKPATRTLLQLRNRGLIESAEVAVARSKPTQGFKDEDLGLAAEEPFADAWSQEDRSWEFPVPAMQLHTEELLAWLKARAAAGDGSLGSFTNADAARAIGMTNLSRQGRAFGNIQSRVDFACYRARLPPLGTRSAPSDKRRKGLGLQRAVRIGAARKGGGLIHQTIKVVVTPLKRPGGKSCNVAESLRTSGWSSG